MTGKWCLSRGINSFTLPVFQQINLFFKYASNTIAVFLPHKFCCFCYFGKNIKLIGIGLWRYCTKSTVKSVRNTNEDNPAEGWLFARLFKNIFIYIHNHYIAANTILVICKQNLFFTFHTGKYPYCRNRSTITPHKRLFLVYDLLQQRVNCLFFRYSCHATQRISPVYIDPFFSAYCTIINSNEV